MSPFFNRRDWLKVMGIAGAGALLPHDAMAVADGAPLVAHPAPVMPGAQPPVVPLTSTSEIFIPPRGRSFMKFSFDFPEPSVAFGGYTFGFLVFTPENTYGLDQSKMKVEGNGDSLKLTCDGFVWAGGQMKEPGRLTASLRRSGATIEWDAVIEMDRPIRTITSIVRSVPRGKVSFSGDRFTDPKDNELLMGYAFGAGDLNGPGGSMVTPLLMIQTPDDVFYVSSLDERMRPKRYYLAPGDSSYRVEAIYEHDAWRNDHRVELPTWRLGRTTSSEEATALHMRHIEKAFGLKPWEERSDVPAWMRNIALATTLHGMHYTGYIFNDYAKMLEILRWMSKQIAGERVLVFVSAWDGRYYWDYPNYVVSERMGGDAGIKRGAYA